MVIGPTGDIFMIGSINSVDYSHGLDDILMVGLTITGKTIFIENVGGSLNDNPAGLVYNLITDKVNVFGNT